MPEPFAIPPLPEDWPYSPREAGPALQAVSSGSLGPGWSLLAAGPALEGEPKPLADAFGRGGIHRIGDVVVRPYRRGGLVRHVNERLYASPGRFEQEYAVHRALWTAGFPTVEPLGYGFRRRLWGVEGVFLTRLAEAEAWPSCWERTAEVLPGLAVMLEALAAWGLHAPDLNATNILVTAEGHVLALDWDRAIWSAGTDLRLRYRERLQRSLLKLGAPEDVLRAFGASAEG